MCFVGTDDGGLVGCGWDEAGGRGCGDDGGVLREVWECIELLLGPVGDVLDGVFGLGEGCGSEECKSEERCGLVFHD